MTETHRKDGFENADGRQMEFLLKPLVMVLPIAVLALAGVAIRCFWPHLFVRPHVRPGKAGFPKLSPAPLLTPTERAFFQALCQSCPNGIHISCKVRVEDLVRIDPSTPKKERFAFRNRIKSRHFDFVAVDRGSTSARLIIELDDKSHETSKAAATDALKNEVASSIGINLIRVQPACGYDLSSFWRQYLPDTTNAHATSSAGELHSTRR